MGKMVVHCAENLPYGFTKVNNEILRSGLSSNAFMVLTFVLSVPADWDFSLSGTAAVLPLSERTIARALTELKQKGFYQVNKSKRKSGQYETRTHIFYDYPSLSNDIKPKRRKKLPAQNPSPKMRDKSGAGKTQQKTSSCPVDKSAHWNYTGNYQQNASSSPADKNHIVDSADNKDIYNKYLINKNIDIKEDLISNENPKSIENEISDFLSDLNITKIKNGGDYLH